MSEALPRGIRPRDLGILALIVGLLLAFAFAIASLRENGASPRTALPGRKVAPAPILPMTPPPKVEPTVLADLTPDLARADNAKHPFDKGPLSPARPFLYAGSPQDRAAARACLAAAVLYEAGDDREGEQAVAQVVLNRLRHPAFPKTVCGVVFEGSERSTGCQFTFTCDGSLNRTPRLVAWQRALSIADDALSGIVDKTVGTATHYHTDWVVPYWRDTLTKIAMVHTHIFYRWQGWWGLPKAFSGQPQPFEHLDPRLIAIAGPGTIPGAGMPDGLAPDPAEPSLTSQKIAGVPPRALQGNIVRLKDDESNQYVLQLDPKASAGSYAVVAFTICADHPDCLVLGWTEEGSLPHVLPVMPRAMRSVDFIYRKSSIAGLNIKGWNCRRFKRAVLSECVPGTE